jgi:hypothetical protein
MLKIASKLSFCLTPNLNENLGTATRRRTRAGYGAPCPPLPEIKVCFPTRAQAREEGPP